MANFIDLTGLVFSRLTVLCKDNNVAFNGGIKWLCKCICGNLVSVRSDGLRSGHSKSCGCLNREISSAKVKLNLTGKIFGRLVVLKEDSKTSAGEIKWLCQCSCGNVKSILAGSLLKGLTLSCGCYKKEINRKQAIILNRKLRVKNGLNPDVTLQSAIEKHRSKFKKIRKTILNRDEHKCILCSETGCLHVHHIVPLFKNASTNLDINNLITLCETCHFSYAHINGNTQTVDAFYQHLFKEYLKY